MKGSKYDFNKRASGVLNAKADNFLWEKGCTLIYSTRGSSWPSTEPSKELIAKAADVAVWVYNQIDLGITLVHEKDTTEGVTHPIIYGGPRNDQVAAVGNFPTTMNPKIIFFESALTQEPGRILSRMIHEIGHTLGFYHEFEAGTEFGVLVGKTDPLSIMGYRLDRQVRQSDITSFSNIYKIKSGTIIYEGTGAAVKYKKPKIYDRDSLRNSDVSREAGILGGIFNSITDIFRIFDINQNNIEKDSDDASSRSQDIGTFVEVNELTESYITEINRNSGFLLGLASGALNALTSVGTQVLSTVGTELLSTFATGALDRGSDGIVRPIPQTSEELSLQITNIFNQAGMKSISLGVDSLDTDVKNALICGEWLLGKYKQMLLFKVTTEDDLGSKEAVAKYSTDILQEFTSSFGLRGFLVQVDTSTVGSSRNEMLQKVIETALGNRTLPPKIQFLIRTQINPENDATGMTKDPLFGHISACDLREIDNLQLTRLTFYSIIGNDLNLRYVTFNPVELLKIIKKDQEKLEEVLGIAKGKKEQISGTLQIGIPSSIVGDQGDDGRANDGTVNKHVDAGIHIAMACVNPSAPKDGWLTLLNVSKEKQMIGGWTLTDGNDESITFNGTILPGASLKIYPHTY